MSEETTVSAEDISAALDNSSEVTEQTEPQISDNSEIVEKQEPNQEQDATNDGTQENNQDEADNKPNNQKFDNLEDALKGYANLEKKLGEQSNELGELRKQAELAKQYEAERLAVAQHYGFDSADDFKNALEQQKYDSRLASYEADLYAQFLDRCDFPDQMQNLLMSYRNNPSKETLELIEADFPVDVIKQVASAKALTKQQLDNDTAAKQQAAYEEQIKSTAKAYLDENVSKYADDFNNPAFAELYGEAFRAYGCDLQTDRFVELMHKYGESVVKAANITNGITKENEDATNEMAGLVSRGNADVPITNKDIENMSEKELAKAISKYV